MNEIANGKITSARALPQCKSEKFVDSFDCFIYNADELYSTVYAADYSTYGAAVVG